MKIFMIMLKALLFSLVMAFTLAGVEEFSLHAPCVAYSMTDQGCIKSSATR